MAGSASSLIRLLMQPCRSLISGATSLIDFALLLSGKRRSDGLHEGILAERLAQERECRAARCLASGREVFVRTDQDGRDASARGEQFALQLEAAHAGHPDIDDQAPRVGAGGVFEELLGGGKQRDPEAE